LTNSQNLLEDLADSDMNSQSEVLKN